MNAAVPMVEAIRDDVSPLGSLLQFDVHEYNLQERWGRLPWGASVRRGLGGRCQVRVFWHLYPILYNVCTTVSLCVCEARGVHKNL